MLKTVSSVANALGALNYKGTWNANTNTPALASGVGTKGDYYVVSVAGATDLDGITNWGVGDWATFNGSVWQRVEGGADGNFVNLDVTGTATMGGLTVSKTYGSIVKLESTGTGLGSGTVIGDLQFYGNDASTPGAGIKASITATTVAALGDDSQLMFSTSDGTTNNVNRMLIANNGDVSFYEDTGTTPKFVWDASAESLGIGTTSPTSALHVNGTGTGGTAVEIEQTATSISNSFYTMMIDSSSQISNLTNAGAFSVDVNSGRAFVINGHGNVGIGTSSPQELLHLAATAPVFRLEGASRTYQQYVSGTNFFIRDVTAGLNRVTLDASGNVAIGTTTVNSKFNVASSQDALKYNEGVTVFRSTGSNKMFLNCVGGGANIVGSNSPITFNYHDQTTNNVTEAMRIVSGNLLVGKTSSDLGVTAGIELNGQYDVGYFTRSAEKALVVNRLSFRRLLLQSSAKTAQALAPLVLFMVTTYLLEHQVIQDCSLVVL
jgi:hypothetical protein